MTEPRITTTTSTISRTTSSRSNVSSGNLGSSLHSVAGSSSSSGSNLAPSSIPSTRFLIDYLDEENLDSVLPNVATLHALPGGVSARDALKAAAIRARKWVEFCLKPNTSWSCLEMYPSTSGYLRLLKLCVSLYTANKAEIGPLLLIKWPTSTYIQRIFDLFLVLGLRPHWGTCLLHVSSAVVL